MQFWGDNTSTKSWLLYIPSNLSDAYDRTASGSLLDEPEDSIKRPCTLVKRDSECSKGRSLLADLGMRVLHPRLLHARA